MAFSLYDATIPTYLQILGSMRTLADAAAAHCVEKGVSEADLLNSHFGEDMRPLSWQLKWASSHSIGAIEGVRKGGYSPDMAEPPADIASIKAQIDDSISALQAVTPEEMDSFVGKEMIFTIGDKLRIDFLAERFLMSFSIPNFLFHATTAYDLLRDQGVAIGKRDFLGALQMEARKTL